MPESIPECNIVAVMQTYTEQNIVVFCDLFFSDLKRTPGKANHLNERRANNAIPYQHGSMFFLSLSTSTFFEQKMMQQMV